MRISKSVRRLAAIAYEKDGETIYGLAFTCEEIDYLDTNVA